MREINAPTFEATGEGYKEVSTFSIKANAKAFRILIDGLYSDKPRAIVREIASNALDSHIMAGCPEKPFDCHLPNRLEPYFSIRDYGVSLSHDLVMRLYTTVFESTKEDSNSQVGRFGLGSKTPFAYTEAYTVTAYLDGEARMYNAFIDSNGVPSIALLVQEPTTEPNGIEVSFPVSTADCNSFV
jgi:HSP90 family molecular chaperone